MQRDLTLQTGQQLPHFVVRALDGSTFAYSDVWQHRNLLLILLPDTEAAARARYAAQVQAHMPELTAHDTTCVIAQDDVSGIPRPGVVVADKWGEVHFVTAPGTVTKLPEPSELIDWLRYVQMQCPECQGEAK
jgi:hypothetical protein